MWDKPFLKRLYKLSLPIMLQQLFIVAGNTITTLMTGQLGDQAIAASGLAYQMGFLDGTVIAFTSLEWKFRAPVFIGDTLRVQVKVTSRREMKQAGGGFVTFDVKIVNQDGTVTQKGEWTVLVASKPQPAAS